MRASARTLQNFLDLIPASLARRYNPSLFGVGAGNEVLSEIEQACDPDLFIGETGLLLSSGVTDYALGSSVRHVKGLYGVADGEAAPDTGHPIAHSIVGNKIRLSSEPTLSSEADITGTVDSGAPSDLSKVYDNTAGILNTLQADALKGRLIRVTHTATGVVEDRILKGNTPGSFTADINGVLDSLAVVGDTYLITANFLVLVHNRYVRRLTATTDVVDVPLDFEFLFRAGLTHKYYLQADSLSKETKQWEDKYAEQMQLFRIDTTKPRGTSIRNSPRSIPSLFP